MAPPTRRTADSKMAAAIATGCRRGPSEMAALGRWLWLGGARLYNARPLRRRLGGVYVPDPADPRTPAYQLKGAFKAKLFGRHGAASGVDPARLWPTPEELRAVEAEEKDWPLSLREMEAALDAKEQQAAAQARQREELIAARMAKMPQMIADWKREKAEKKAKELEEKERRQLLLAEARERFGHNLDHRSAQFQELIQEMEKTRRKELKLQKKRLRDQAVAQKLLETAPVPSNPDKEEEAAAPVSPPAT